MKLLITIHNHFLAVGEEVYSHIATYERFWKRYLQVFDSVLVVARVRSVDKVPSGWGKATGDGVEFRRLPDYVGPWQYLRVCGKVKSIITDAIRNANAYLLRAPDLCATLVWKNLPAGYPFGVEVVIDPWDTFAPGSVRSVGRPYFRFNWTRNLRKQCLQATAVSYVTKKKLQERYPPAKHCVTANYSSVELEREDLCTNIKPCLASISKIPDRLDGKGPPIRLGFIGSFSQGYKLPDIHIKAFAKCLARGANLTLDMIGEGTLLEKMKTLAQRLGVAESVSFRGLLPAGKQILDAIDKFDLLLNATRAEGLPRVIIEAMSRGCPVIASNIAGVPELLNEMYLVRPNDVNDLAKKILQVLKDPQSMAQTAKRNLYLAKEYCRDVLEPRRKEFYSALRQRTEEYLNARVLHLLK